MFTEMFRARKGCIDRAWFLVDSKGFPRDLHVCSVVLALRKIPRGVSVVADGGIPPPCHPCSNVFLAGLHHRALSWSVVYRRPSGGCVQPGDPARSHTSLLTLHTGWFVREPPCCSATLPKIHRVKCIFNTRKGTRTPYLFTTPRVVVMQRARIEPGQNDGFITVSWTELKLDRGIKITGREMVILGGGSSCDARDRFRLTGVLFDFEIENFFKITSILEISFNLNLDKRFN